MNIEHSNQAIAFSKQLAQEREREMTEVNINQASIKMQVLHSINVEDEATTQPKESRDTLKTHGLLCTFFHPSKLTEISCSYNVYLVQS